MSLYRYWFSLVAALLGVQLLVSGCSGHHQSSEKGSGQETLLVGISPYQDIAQILNYKKLGLEAKYNVKLDLITLSWDDIPQAVASKGRTVDVAFGSLTEWLSKSKNMNSEADDPVLFIYPAYVFRGGGFISFNQSMPEITRQNMSDQLRSRNF